MAEVELGAPEGQYPGRRIGDDAGLEAALTACARDRNAEGSRVDWRFTTADA